MVTSSLQAAPPLADRLPADATIYAGWAGRNHAFDGSFFGQFIEELPADKIVGAIRQGVGTKIDDVELRTLVGHGMEMFLIAAARPTAFCVTDLSTEGGEQAPVPSMALLIDLGKDRPAFSEHLDALLVMASEHVTFQDAAVGSVTYRTCRVAPEAPPLAVGYIDDMLFVAVGADMPGELIALREDADKSLLNAPAFAAAYREVAGDGEQSAFYADVPAVASMVARIVEAVDGPPLGEQGNLLRALGLGKIKAVASATRVADRRLVTKTRIFSAAPHQGLLMLMAGAPLMVEDMAVAPADADLVLTCNLDPSALWAETRRVIGAIDLGAAAEFDQVVAQIDRQLGFSIENDLLAHMGDQFTLVSAPSLGGFLTGTAVVVELKDGQAFQAAVDKLQAIAEAMLTPPPGYERRRRRPSLHQVDAGGTTIHYVQIPEALAVAPAWAVHDGKLIIAAWPQVVRALVEGPGVGGLNAHPPFVQAFGRLSAAPTGLAYVNEPALARRLYGAPQILWTIIATKLNSEGLDVKVDWLPSLPTLLRCMRPSLSTISADEGGFTQESFRALPVSALNLTTPAVATSILLPALGRARQRARQAVSMCNLKAIGAGVAMYRVDNRDRTPADLDVLVGEGLLPEKSLTSPTSGQRYQYIPLPVDAGNTMILAYEEPVGRRGAETAVLFNDMHVEMVPADEAFWDRVSKSMMAAGMGEGR